MYVHCQTFVMGSREREREEEREKGRLRNKEKKGWGRVMGRKNSVCE